MVIWDLYQEERKPEYYTSPLTCEINHVFLETYVSCFS